MSRDSLYKDYLDIKSQMRGISPKLSLYAKLQGQLADLRKRMDDVDGIDDIDRFLVRQTATVVPEAQFLVEMNARQQAKAKKNGIIMARKFKHSTQPKKAKKEKATRTVLTVNGAIVTSFKKDILAEIEKRRARGDAKEYVVEYKTIWSKKKKHAHNV